MAKKKSQRKSQRYTRRLQNTPGPKIFDDSLDRLLLELALPKNFVSPDDYREFTGKLPLNANIPEHRDFRAKALKSVQFYGPPNSVDRKLAKHAQNMEGIRGLLENPAQSPANKKALQEVLADPATKEVPRKLIKRLAEFRRAKGLLPLLALSLIIGGAGMVFSKENEA
jgi:hypothetical protein